MYFLQRKSYVVPLVICSLERLGPQATSVSLTPLAKHSVSQSDLLNLVWKCMCVSVFEALPITTAHLVFQQDTKRGGILTKGPDKIM